MTPGPLLSSPCWWAPLLNLAQDTALLPHPTTPLHQLPRGQHSTTSTMLCKITSETTSVTKKAETDTTLRVPTTSSSPTVVSRRSPTLSTAILASLLTWPTRERPSILLISHPNPTSLLPVPHMVNCHECL
nr:uncharacterized protein LOC113808430 [Penaeus vannamei]